MSSFSQIGSVNLYSHDDCLRKFDSNHHLGALLFAGIVMSVLLKKKDSRMAESSDSGHSTSIGATTP